MMDWQHEFDLHYASYHWERARFLWAHNARDAYMDAHPDDLSNAVLEMFNRQAAQARSNMGVYKERYERAERRLTS